MSNVGTITIENTRLVFRNFTGKETTYNREGDRNACVIIPDHEVAQLLQQDGWNVKYLRDDEEGNPGDPYIKANLNYKGRPPQVTLLTDRGGRTHLGENEVDILDWADIINVDVILRPYEWVVGGNTGISAYLQTMYITIEENELDSKYSDVNVVGRAGMDD